MRVHHLGHYSLPCLHYTIYMFLSNIGFFCPPADRETIHLQLRLSGEDTVYSPSPNHLDSVYTIAFSFVNRIFIFKTLFVNTETAEMAYIHVLCMSKT